MKYLLALSLVIGVISLSAQDEMKISDVPGDIMVDVGMNFWDVSSDGIDQGAWPSKSVAIYFAKRKGLNNNFSFIYGLGLGLDKIEFGNSNSIFSANDTVSAYFGSIPLDTTFAIKKNRLASTYLEIPLEIRYHIGGTENGEGPFIGVGGIVGLMMNAHSKLKYDNGSELVVQKVKGRYDLSGIRYAAQFRFGFKGINLFYKRYFSNVFRNEIVTEGSSQSFNPVMTTIGINVTGF